MIKSIILLLTMVCPLVAGDSKFVRKKRKVEENFSKNNLIHCDIINHTGYTLYPTWHTNKIVFKIKKEDGLFETKAVKNIYSCKAIILYINEKNKLSFQKDYSL